MVNFLPGKEKLCKAVLLEWVGGFAIAQHLDSGQEFLHGRLEDVLCIVQQLKQQGLHLLCAWQEILILQDSYKLVDNVDSKMRYSQQFLAPKETLTVRLYVNNTEYLQGRS